MEPPGPALLPRSHMYAVDLESWVSSSHPRVSVPPEERKRLDAGGIARQAEEVLGLLDELDTRLTWFVSGEIYEWRPDIVEEIAARGHEIGYHAHLHERLDSAAALEQELQHSEKFLARFQPRGFQAPLMVMPGDGYRVLREYGIRYSSSRYDSVAAASWESGVLEVPVSAWRFRGEAALARNGSNGLTMGSLTRRLPYGSSYFLGLLGSRVIGALIERHARRGIYSNLFIHNWNIFDEGAAARRERRSVALSNPLFVPYLRNMRSGFEYLLRRFSFTTHESALRDLLAAPP